ncbi:MAG: hypothetical protein FD123_3054 [Bacteroidetes bacterium]|nr:MAG: hypothetical protein FD123_3054 [Bacteroidota bacterium]
MFIVEGSGKIVSRERAISSFIKLHASFNGNIEITQSDEERVVVECDDNLQEYIDVNNMGRTLYITDGGGIRKAKYTHILVRVFLRQVDTIISSMHGNLYSANCITAQESLYLEINSHGNTSLQLKTPSFKCLARCQGDVELSGECGEASIKTMMQGDLHARKLLAGKITLKNMGEGKMEIFGKEQIMIRHMGQGSVHYYGPGQLKDVNMMGDGEIKHKTE